MKKRRESFIVGIPLLFTLECLFATMALLLDQKRPKVSQILTLLKSLSGAMG